MCGDSKQRNPKSQPPTVNTKIVRATRLPQSLQPERDTILHCEVLRKVIGKSANSEPRFSNQGINVLEPSKFEAFDSESKDQISYLLGYENKFRERPNDEEVLP